jgi:hypothetical protein
MSLSSLAQESALRLSDRGTAPPTTEAVAASAAAATLSAKTGGDSDAEALKKGREAGESTSGSAPSVQAGPLAVLVKYIPTETMTLYIAVAAAFGEITVPQGKQIHDADFQSRWIAVAVLLVITLAIALALSYRAQKDVHTQGDFKFRTPWFDVSAAGVAFLVWALSLPTTPLRDFEGYEYEQWNPVVILGGTLLIAIGAFAFGKTVTWKKVLD